MPISHRMALSKPSSRKIDHPRLKVVSDRFPNEIPVGNSPVGNHFLGFSDFTDLLSKGLMAAVASLMEVYSIWIRGYLPIINDVTPTSSPSESNPGRYQRITWPLESTTVNSSLCNPNSGLGNLSRWGSRPPFKCSK